jgi:hypothetical protein
MEDDNTRREEEIRRRLRLSHYPLRSAAVFHHDAASFTDETL